VLLGEATHGTSEFYRMRARITEELILRSGFNIVAAEADWPDAARIDRYVRHQAKSSTEWRAFSRFPTWMWRNQETLELVEWLREVNRDRSDDGRVSFNGLDLYSMATSADTVIRYLEKVDPNAARIARQRYGCLSPWESDPSAYGLAAVSGQYRHCEGEVVATLREMLTKRLEYSENDGDQWFDAVQNANLVVNAEQYYRAMYYSTNESWNLRDQHMFSTLESLLEQRGPKSKAIVWAHNSHIGDASATEMGLLGELNIGELARKKFGDKVYAIGFGTDHGTVAAASAWDGPRETKNVRPALAESYEGLAHETGIGAFLLPLRSPSDESLHAVLNPMRLERAIGVIYRPDTERRSHYFNASLPRQFDEWIFFDETHAVTPLGAVQRTGIPDTYPFGL
jgi:protein-L-isoaspartate(D-aspartate) O-methyltransferase